MANIKDKLNNIQNALFGHEVRGSIHDGIEAINNEVEDTTSRQYVLENTFEELTITAGNSNAEIVAARVEADGTTHKKLGDRLNKVDSQINETMSQLEHTVNKIYYLNIMDFINGNDITNALNLAINTIKENGEIVIPPGNYTISSTITVNKPLTIKCYGVIQRANNMNGILFNITSNNVILDSFTIDGNLDNQKSDDDCIVIYNASYCTIKNVNMYNVCGNGILVLKSSNNIIENNVLDNIKYNAIFIANKGSDKNRIINNTIKSTILQNAIFLTASGDSTATEDYIYDNIVKSNIVYSAGDTSIETGIHTVGTIISDNIVYIKNLPGILLRDAKNIIVCNNTVNALDSTTTDGIAIVQQTEPMTFITNSSIINNKLIGYFPRSGIFINQSSVIVSSNSIENSTRGICVAGSNDIIISDNFIKNNLYGIDLNYGAGIQELNNIKINNNFIKNNEYSINFYNTTLNNSSISNNTIKDSVKNVFVFAGSKGVNSYIKDNIITNIDTNVKYDRQTSGFITDIFKVEKTLNLNQYDATKILDNDLASLHLKINIYIKENRETYGEFYIKDQSIYLLKNASSDIVLNSSSFSGWSILFDNYSQLIIQRRGESLIDSKTLVVEYEFI